jgi:uncharacterized protein
MEAIYIPQLLKAPNKTEEVPINEQISDLDTLTPIRGKVKVRHCGTYLDVKGQAETIVTLSCDRCLQQYNHRLSVSEEELIWLDPKADEPEEVALEREVPLEDLSESLSPSGYFDPFEWLYEQLCLALPQRQLCSTACEGIASEHRNQPKVDSRWASLAALKEQLS